MKRLFLEFERCDDCPYCQYNGDYGRSYDSGYDCVKTGNRIVDDWDCNNSNNKHPKPNPFKIPEWCPLETYE